MKSCKHEFEEHMVYWDQDTGKLHQELRCILCGHISDGWTLPDTEQGFSQEEEA
jgi:hypothetical protein